MSYSLLRAIRAFKVVGIKQEISQYSAAENYTHYRKKVGIYTSNAAVYSGLNFALPLIPPQRVSKGLLASFSRSPRCASWEQGKRITIVSSNWLEIQDLFFLAGRAGLCRGKTTTLHPDLGTTWDRHSRPPPFRLNRRTALVSRQVWCVHVSNYYSFAKCSTRPNSFAHNIFT